MIKLELPLTLRIPRLDEVPKVQNVIESIERANGAKIVEGFTLKSNESNEYPFKFYAEINVDNSRLWDLFKTLAFHLPEEISLIFNHSDADPVYGQYRDKFEVFNVISELSYELTKDCFLEFGVIFNTDDFLEEVFVDSSKYIKYWGMDLEWFRQTMHEFNLFETPDLNFMDEFPKVREAIDIHYSGTRSTQETIEKLRKHFTN